MTPEAQARQMIEMIATGTDVKPLECLIVMRNIRSLAYFEQMKGRGCRIIDADSLIKVTPDASAKTHFVIVDAIGVCEEDTPAIKPLDRQPHRAGLRHEVEYSAARRPNTEEYQT